ncbi:hypothetical protein BHECKSOX_197 [Bathymodiolus heckerae thiotrophic gill symbiont]|uniref:type II toxin-antitoxin system RelE/ParE family toxin n=1 Tax=Bathymodiolus heckerae thiotrophic gill symbiont TaxID=1052212 RepID=UPI0010B7C26C|nr:type II toxin-antitoxin system RelE/ParE family toxin [Bathymodiolus heckerae thiotrophic gill symbiont]CAC9593099.1 RelE-like translational repressor toxin [uncultured Gammaproteobacteria bacterium]SHN93413.1 hypothetical protein BHECKSOX_197 [Bathymodiolus heckerae thiotrophic gill symbiont]
MQTIVELPEFIKKSSKLLDSSERNGLISYLAIHVKSGDLIKGTGGIRKLRWSAQGKGKSGGVRVVYFYYNKSMPLFLLSVFGKGEKTNLSKSECNELTKLTKILKNSYGVKK